MRELKTVSGPQETKEMLTFTSPALSLKLDQLKQVVSKMKVDRVQKYCNSDNMRLSLTLPASSYKKLVNKTVQDPKDINGKFDAEKYGKSVMAHAVYHKQANVAARDGRLFYLK